MLHDKEESLLKIAEISEIKEKMRHQTTHIEIDIISAG